MREWVKVFGQIFAERGRAAVVEDCREPQRLSSEDIQNTRRVTVLEAIRLCEIHNQKLQARDLESAHPASLMNR